jgi:hypothetical protein
MSSIAEDKIKEYNDEPVCWCNRCLSLNIIREAVSSIGYIDYCADCSSNSVSEGHIREWQKLKIINSSSNGRESK